MVTRGEYTLEKVSNMHAWLAQELGKENVPQFQLTQTIATALVSQLATKKQLIEKRDLPSLLACEIPADLRTIAELVLRNPKLHDKFWRYADLFLEIAAS